MNRVEYLIAAMVLVILTIYMIVGVVLLKEVAHW